METLSEAGIAIFKHSSEGVPDPVLSDQIHAEKQNLQRCKVQFGQDLELFWSSTRS